MKKIVLVLCIIMLGVLTSACGYSNDEPCAWCSDTPTKGFSSANGGTCYVCEGCSSSCSFCDQDATKHYTNLLGLEVFVCNDCYEEVVE